MCSVSFLPHARGFYLGMNRDESRQRPAAHVPEVLPCSACAALYPTEPSGGSWVGVNDAGLTLALINWYAIPTEPDIRRVSRGVVVPTLLAAAGAGEVGAAIRGLPLHDLAPFRLLTFAPRDRTVLEFRWDQHTLAELPHGWEPQHWFSSGYDEPRAQHERSATARTAWREARAGSLAWLRRLHASHQPARGPFSVCMHRDDAATVSYTEVVVTGRTATMRYHDGPLCAVPEPSTTRHLPLHTTRARNSSPSHRSVGRR